MPLCCTFRVEGSIITYKIRVKHLGCKVYMSFVNLDYGLPISTWLAPGVELQWVLLIEPTCRRTRRKEKGKNVGSEGDGGGGKEEKE